MAKTKLDDAWDKYADTNARTDAVTLIETALEYYKDEMIGDDTFRAALVFVGMNPVTFESNKQRRV